MYDMSMHVQQTRNSNSQLLQMVAYVTFFLQMMQGMLYVIKEFICSILHWLWNILPNKILKNQVVTALSPHECQGTEQVPHMPVL
jgi:hypothetical protein